MKLKELVVAAAFVIGTSGVAPAPALANVYFVQCDAQTCYEITCATMPNVNGLGWEAAGCVVIGTYPRPLEVGGE